MQSAAVAGEVEQDNPLIEGLERLPVRPTALVIFGATGDLAHRKLLPALYNLAHEGALPERFELVGVARREQEHDDFREMARESIERFSSTSRSTRSCAISTRRQGRTSTTSSICRPHLSSSR